MLNPKRQKLLRLWYSLLLDIAGIVFGVVGLALLGYKWLTPTLRDQPFGTSLEQALGHIATFIVFVVFCLFIMIVSALWARQPLRLLRNKAYLEAEEPPFEEQR